MNSFNPQIYLASTSPRRYTLLKQMNLKFEVIEICVLENRAQNESAEIFVKRMATEKALAGLNSMRRNKKIPILGADTIVVLGNKILGKPEDRDEALSMLEQLSGKTHQVYSAVAMVSDSVEISMRTSISKVSFRDIDPKEREAYICSKEPFGKAGAYAIQGTGAVFISEITGSYSGVMGLPLYETADLLGTFGIRSYDYMPGSFVDDGER